MDSKSLKGNIRLHHIKGGVRTLKGCEGGDEYEGGGGRIGIAERMHKSRNKG